MVISHIVIDKSNTQGDQFMTRGDWAYIGVSTILTAAIDSFLKSEDAKKMNLKNRQQFINRLITDFFWKSKGATGIDHMKFDAHPGILDLLDPKTKKTKK